MGTLTLFFIAVGLAMDAFAVSVSNGICFRRAGFREALYTALTFGIFQAGMPVLGYFAGRTVSGAVEFLDHWIALILLGAIGGNMVREGILELRSPGTMERKDSCSFRGLMLQGVATSIDAFAVGISLALMKTNIAFAGVVIGAVTFVCSLAGVYIGRTFGAALKQKAEIFGGCILILIGIKIFAEHITGA